MLFSKCEWTRISDGWLTRGQVCTVSSFVTTVVNGTHTREKSSPALDLCEAVLLQFVARR